jgi:hypothetical protein
MNQIDTAVNPSNRRLLRLGAAFGCLALGCLADALAFELVWNDRDSFDGALFVVLASPLAAIALAIALGGLGWRGGVLVTAVLCALTCVQLASIANDESSTAVLGLLAAPLLLWVAALLAILVALWWRAIDEPLETYFSLSGCY